LKVSENEQIFLLPLHLVATTKRIGLESKLHPDACFDLQFYHCLLCNHIPQTVNTNNRTTTGLQPQNCELKQEYSTHTTELQLVSQPQNCELKQELCALATELQLVSQPQNCELKQELCTLTTELQLVSNLKIVS